MKAIKKMLALTLSVCMIGGSMQALSVSAYAAEENGIQINQDSNGQENNNLNNDEDTEKQTGQQNDTNTQMNPEDDNSSVGSGNNTNTEETGENQLNQDDSNNLLNAQSEDLDGETQQNGDTESGGQQDSSDLDADPSAENSWRYSNGSLISQPSARARAGYPYAWEKVNGKFMNSSGEVIAGAVKKGIDVSEHNGEIDWQKVKNDGIDFAIIRCGYGQDISSQDDKRWAYNVSECERLGIPYGVYLYSYANTVAKAESEAQHVLRLLKGHNPTYPVYYDMEDNVTLQTSDSMKTQMAKAFCNQISANGYQVGIYSNLDWWTNYLKDPVYDSWSRWMAQWNDKCTYTGKYDMWQCTSSGRVDGISGNVDLNFWMESGNTGGSGNSGNNNGEVTAKDCNIAYSTHVQTYGWQNEVKDGAVSGTTGEAKRLEGIRIKLGSGISGGIQYNTHVQTYGWLDFVSNGEVSGTTGEAKRLEAIKIQLTGEAKNKYDVYYSVHAQTYGWLGWAKNGEPAGTSGYAKRLEGIKIMLVPKGGQAPGSTENAYVEKGASVNYRTHVQTYGWQNYVSDGAVSGTTGQAKRLEAIQISLGNQNYSGGIEYCTHVQTYGWQDFVSNGSLSGTSGLAKRLEAIKIRLTGEMSEKYDIYYRVHAQTYGWLGWAKNGEAAGTAGYAKRLEGIQIQLVPKGGSAPGSTENCYYEK